MPTVKFTALQIGEIAHKLCIVRDEPDLLESYALTEQDAAEVADLFLAAKPGAVTFDQRFCEVIAGEIEDRMNPLLSNWKDCGDEDEGAVYRSLKRAHKAVLAACGS